jgi:nuclear transport factor 2 (NTF2) superfamily protein
VALAYNRLALEKSRQFPGAEIIEFLKRKWAKELDYRLIRNFGPTMAIAVAAFFAYEWHDDSGHWCAHTVTRLGI